MSTTIYTELAWLPSPPPDFRKQVHAVAKQPSDVGRAIRALASFALDENQLNWLAKAINQVTKEGRSLNPLTPFRLGILGNGTLDFLIPALTASAARHGFALECVKADYDQAIQEALSPTSVINHAKPNAVLIVLDYRGFPLRFTPTEPDIAASSVQLALQHLDTIRAGIRQNGSAVSIVQTLAPPVETLFGSFDRATMGTSRSLVERLNSAIVESVANSEDLLLDVASLAETVGLAAWHDPTHWNLAKVPFSSTFVPLYADHVARLISASQGKSRRCLVLDLDNTIWGGVIGDDGLDGIRLVQGDATGEAHLSLQRLALSLRERGVVLAVSSKNDDEVARKVFREHPDMLLRENHIAVFQANWNDKASNIKAIADELALGLESLVFLDDNPMERGLVRKILPEVAVPELPEDPALYARTLAAAGYFESARFSDEDRKRADFYQLNARRVALRNQVADVSAYLASLDMEITFQPFDSTGRVRITQLINKSNQFNLTTRRYTEADVTAAARDPKCFTLQVRLTDTFGDNGMISVIICRQYVFDAWEIDTWLMSCRVLGRGVEKMVLKEILNHSALRGVRRLVGIYRPTARNSMVQDHYANLGFAHIETRAGGDSVWQLATNVIVDTIPMRVRRVGFDMTRTTDQPVGLRSANR
jgi:FkbH-like protein